MSFLQHPALIDCRRLFLRDYETSTLIGVYDSEQNKKQRIRLNISLYIPLSLSTPQHDQFDEVVDYDLMREAIVKRLAQGHIALQETLCDDLASALLSHPSVRAVHITSEKLDVYPDCAAVGVEVFRIKS